MYDYGTPRQRKRQKKKQLRPKRKSYRCFRHGSMLKSALLNAFAVIRRDAQTGPRGALVRSNTGVSGLLHLCTSTVSSCAEHHVEWTRPGSLAPCIVRPDQNPFGPPRFLTLPSCTVVVHSPPLLALRNTSSHPEALHQSFTAEPSTWLYPEPQPLPSSLISPVAISTARYAAHAEPILSERYNLPNACIRARNVPDIHFNGCQCRRCRGPISRPTSLPHTDLAGLHLGFRNGIGYKSCNTPIPKYFIVETLGRLR
ncbi:hypothetical protein BDV95DRAFT_645136 [Massariosphaeria phaeospora]|uniref:Uncharacterized protein n=1 Tax=Massariosphaeria phaeospora TaxID=100035 RepID=A0A7C8MJ54_9PLEO|nr:hypothetical protein BDV95DRAFT_645136 [Massariosphaeria phaeospora]